MTRSFFLTFVQPHLQYLIRNRWDGFLFKPRGFHPKETLQTDLASIALKPADSIKEKRANSPRRVSRVSEEKNRKSVRERYRICMDKCVSCGYVACFVDAFVVAHYLLS